jgi:hypothetical protein
MRLQNWLSVLLGLTLISSTGCGTNISPSPKSLSFSKTSSPSPIGGALRGSGGQASNARSGPATGGATGTVDNVSKSGFTMTTSTGVKVTVNETSSTKYKKGTSSTSVKAITKGKRVLALGTVSAKSFTSENEWNKQFGNWGDQRNDHQGHAGNRDTDCDYLWGKGDPLPAR